MIPLGVKIASAFAFTGLISLVWNVPSSKYLPYFSLVQIRLTRASGLSIHILFAKLPFREAGGSPGFERFVFQSTIRPVPDIPPH
jgi:hypothetical protein